MPAVTTFDAGKAIMEISAVEKTVDDLFDVRPPEAELLGEAIVVNPDEFFKVVFDTTIPARRFRIAWSIDGWSAVHYSEENPSANYSQMSLPEIPRKVNQLSRSSSEIWIAASFADVNQGICQQVGEPGSLTLTGYLRVIIKRNERNWFCGSRKCSLIN